MRSNYIIQKDEKPACPLCYKNVFLLGDEHGRKRSAFYSCFDCKFVTEVGRGVVKGGVEIKNKQKQRGVIG